MHRVRRTGAGVAVFVLLSALCAVVPLAFSVAAAAPSLPAGSVLELQVGGVGGVPANAAAAVVNFTVANPAAVGFVTVYPCGVARPVASNLNFVAGQAVPNLVLAKLGTSGRVCIYSNVATDVIADVSGYFPAGSGFTPIDNPTRILDTRSSLAGQRLGAGSVLELQVGAVGGVPANAAAAVVNFTVANPAAVGFVTVYPCGVARPVASNLNFVAGQAVPNLVLAKLGTSGRVCIYSNVATDVIADVSGYFPAGSGFTPIDNPTRILDTRSSLAGQRLGAGSVLELQVGAVGGVPANAAAAVVNFTVANPAAVGFVTVYPCGVARPVASNLNFVAGQAVPNLVLAKLGTSGRVCIYSNVATDVIADVSGYFPAGSGYVPIDNPTRILDTRGTPSAGGFTESFATDQRSRFDFQLHTSPNGDSATKVADVFVGEHNLACQGPDTHRDVHGGMGAKTFLDVSTSELSWWCAPSGDPAKGHFMTALDTNDIATLSFTPKQTFNNVTQVCWDQNMNNLGAGKWVNVYVVPADDIAAHGGDFSYASASGLAFGGIDRTLPAGSVDFTWLRGSTYVNKWGPNATHSETMSFWASTFGHGMVPEGPLDSAPRFKICLTSGGNMVINRPDGTTDTRAVGTTFPTGAVKVIFQDASYNPAKHDGNANRVSWHWDNIEVSTSASTASLTANVVPASFATSGHDPLQMYCAI